MMMMMNDDVMAQNMICLVGTPANVQTAVLPHGVRPYWVRGPGAHFGLITFFVAHDFWASNGQNPSWGREPYGSISAIFGDSSGWG